MIYKIEHIHNMNQLVDGEAYLHKEEDPRYRGGAIPSKAFKYLQTMTDGTPELNQGMLLAI